MVKEYIFVAFSLILASCSSRAQQDSMLRETVYFPSYSGQLTKLYLKSDTLSTFHVNGIGQEESTGTYRVKQLIKGDVEVYRGEVIRNIEFDRKPIGDFILYVFRRSGPHKLIFIDGKIFKEENEMLSYRDSIHYDRIYGLTYYTRDYFESFKNLKEISTKEDVLKVMNYLESSQAKEIAEAFKKQGMINMYATALTSELLNRACLNLGFNPIRASAKINLLMRE